MSKELSRSQPEPSLGNLDNGTLQGRLQDLLMDKQTYESRLRKINAQIKEIKKLLRIRR